MKAYVAINKKTHSFLCVITKNRPPEATASACSAKRTAKSVLYMNVSYFDKKMLASGTFPIDTGNDRVVLLCYERKIKLLRMN